MLKWINIYLMDNHTLKEGHSVTLLLSTTTNAV